MSADCIFCKITKKETPADFVYEDDTLVVFNDIKPAAPVHLLLVPKVHIPSIINLEGKHREIISALIYTAKDIAKEKGLTGYKLIFNVGRNGGQVIDHLHLHLLGGWDNKNDIGSSY